MSSDFSSIDRLVEFGMGMSLAQQMVNTMNYTMNNMQVAGVNAQSTGTCAPPPTEAPNQWYAAIEGRQVGPLSEVELKKFIRRDMISDSTLLWCPGMPAWRMASDIPQVNKILLLNS